MTRDQNQIEREKQLFVQIRAMRRFLSKDKYFDAISRTDRFAGGYCNYNFAYRVPYWAFDANRLEQMFGPAELFE